MDKIKEFLNERLSSDCIHCGAWIGGAESSEDHVKPLFGGFRESA